MSAFKLVWIGPITSQLAETIKLGDFQGGSVRFQTCNPAAFARLKKQSWNKKTEKNKSKAAMNKCWCDSCTRADNVKTHC